MKVQGNTDSVRQQTLEYIDSFIGGVYEPGAFVPRELAEMMKDVTAEYGREVALCLDRRNTVLSVTLGDAKSVTAAMPDAGRRSAVAPLRRASASYPSERRTDALRNRP